MYITYSNVEFVSILPAREGQKEEYCAVHLRATEIIKNSKTLLLGGEGIIRRRYAIQTMKKTIVSKMNLKPGDDFIQKLKSLGEDFARVYANGGRICTREITQSVYDQLTSDKQKSYQAKLIPANPEKGQYKDIPLYHNGERIYFMNSFVANTEKYSSDNIFECTTKPSEVIEASKKIGAQV